MPSAVEHLIIPVKAGIRTNINIGRREAKIQLKDDPEDRVVQMTIKDSGDDKPEEFRVDDIEQIKVKDFIVPNTNTQSYLLSVNLRTEPVKHISIQFDRKDLRDSWDHGLRSIQPTQGAKTVALAQVKVPGSRYLPIKGVQLLKPEAGQLVAVKLKLGDEKEETLVIPEDKATSDNCKQIVNDFIEDNVILPTENTSLYRYVRSVVQRASMEKEVSAIVEEINNLRFERYAKTKPGEPTENLLTQSKAQLSTLASDLPSRIGQHGSGATVVTQILKRNIEKMKLINEMAAKLK
eukprot:gnl/TRDRNA2_/TRDRNA2_194785_c0_seq1.p1 gnl/TRDRNA2_/TRDRNA2_194785_c0~~gnl/TRDRNA2_/TRDRNA2_194785_c0_seq1.p1  ORF type:complete len:293 (-),score=63.06 gnl/TRDRNA2_/TRDRNA2_194785_c0_seq1:120-998(-)